MIEAITEKQLTVNFMARFKHSEYFYWPHHADRQTVALDGVLSVLNKCPHKVSSRYFDVFERDKIDKLCEHYILG